jgi:hypothetical protein
MADITDLHAKREPPRREGNARGKWWWSCVVQLPGQAMQEATAHPEQFLCAYDGGIYGDRQAKKMARRAGREYISTGGIGQPRLVKTPMEPFGDEEFAEVERALERGYVIPH